jgi:hypothetical protein
MSNRFDDLIKELKDRINGSSDTLGAVALFKTLQDDLPDPNVNTNIPKLNEIVAAFRSQVTNTTNTATFLNPLGGSSATLQDLNTATYLVQVYFQVTQPLEQILSNLVDLLADTDLSALSRSGVGGGNVSLEAIRNDILDILDNRQELQKSLKTALREFGNAANELGLEQLLKNSALILDQLKNSTTLDRLTQVIDALIDHLKAAQKLFKTFNQKDEELTGNEPDEVKQLIRNWGDSLAQIEQIERKSTIQSDLSDPNNSRPAIARTILVHDLLEINYDYLTSLIRSGDLESAGIL